MTYVFLKVSYVFLRKIEREWHQIRQKCKGISVSLGKIHPPPSLRLSRPSPQTKQTHQKKKNPQDKQKNPQIILHPFAFLHGSRDPRSCCVFLITLACCSVALVKTCRILTTNQVAQKQVLQFSVCPRRYITGKPEVPY